MSQTPNAPNIIKTELNRNDWKMVVVACSATESTKGSVVVKNGLIAFRYLKLGSPITFADNMKMPSTITAANNNAQLRLPCSILPIF